AGRRLVGLPAGQQGYRGRLGDAQVRQLQYENKSVLRTELQVNLPLHSGWRRSPGRLSSRRAATSRARAAGWLLCGLVVFAASIVTYGQAAPPTSDAEFLTALGELREASFPDKEAIIDRLGA